MTPTIPTRTRWKMTSTVMMTAVVVIVNDLFHKKLCISTLQNQKCGAAIHPSSSISTTNQQMTTTRVTDIHQAVLAKI
jgi:hypothetical protein